MSKRTERNTKVTPNHKMVTRKDAVSFVRNYLRNPKLKLSGNVQENLLQRFEVEIADDLRNEDWAAVEYSVGMGYFEAIRKDIKVGISTKLFDDVYDIACNILPPKLKGRKTPSITVEKLNAYNVVVEIGEATVCVGQAGSRWGYVKTDSDSKLVKLVDKFLAILEERNAFVFEV